MIGGITLCYSCKHKLQYGMDEKTCAAFPSGIPMSIVLGQIDHRLPTEGDHNIQFEIEEAPTNGTPRTTRGRRSGVTADW